MRFNAQLGIFLALLAGSALLLLSQLTHPPQLVHSVPAVIVPTTKPSPTSVATPRPTVRQPKTQQQAAQEKIDALSWACVEDDFPGARKAVAQGADVNGLSSSGLRPLCQAVEEASHGGHDDSEENATTVRLLLRHDANPRLGNKYKYEAKDEVVVDERSPLEMALGGGHEGSPRPRLIKMLLQAGANANERFEGGSTPLAAAAIYGDMQAMRELLAAGARVNGRDMHGVTPLMEVARYSMGDDGDPRVKPKPAALEFLIAHGAAVNTSDPQGWPPIWYAIVKQESYDKLFDTSRQHGKIIGNYNNQALKVLLAHGAQVNVKDKTGKTPLLWAISTKSDKDGYEISAQVQDTAARAETIRRLVAYDADVNARDAQGWTALMLATKSCYDFTDARLQSAALAPLRLLLAHGANVNARAKDGTTALKIAQHEAQPNVIQLLRVAGAK